MAGVPVTRLRLLDQVIGFPAAGLKAAGLGGLNLYHVTNNNASGAGSLHAGAIAGGNWIVFDGDYSIALSSHIPVNSRTVIDARGASPELTGKGLRVTTETDVIIENLSINNVTGANEDGIRVEQGGAEICRVWIDHCYIYEIIDGHIDTNTANASFDTLVTISNTHFGESPTILPNELTTTVGNNDATRGQYNDRLKVTYYRNWFNGTEFRNPNVNGSRVHVLNNVIAWGNSGVNGKQTSNPDQRADIWVEGNVFDTANAPTQAKKDSGITWDASDQANIKEINNYVTPVASGTLSDINPDSATDPSGDYSYTAATANEALKTDVEANAGTFTWTPGQVSGGRMVI